MDFLYHAIFSFFLSARARAREGDRERENWLGVEVGVVDQNGQKKGEIEASDRSLNSDAEYADRPF